MLSNPRFVYEPVFFSELLAALVFHVFEIDFGNNELTSAKNGTAVIQ